MSINNMRSRWAAVGAAVAVTLGAGGIGITQAVSDSGDGAVSAFFPIAPCRLAENELIGEDSSVTFEGWGETGGCELPDGISALAVNVTAVDATAQTNLRFYPEGAAIPETANLNPTPGAPPTPNAADVTLNATTGQFRVYNRFGTVGVYVDVLGYYDDHTHDDRYYTRNEADEALAAAQPIVTDLSYSSSQTVAPTADWQLIHTVGDFEQVRDGSTIRLDWNAHSSYTDDADTVYCQYQLRIDGRTVAGNDALNASTLFDGGDAAAYSKHAQLALHAIFTDLEPGEHTVAIYVRGIATNCTLNSGPHRQQLTVTEFGEFDPTATPEATPDS